MAKRSEDSTTYRSDELDQAALYGAETYNGDDHDDDDDKDDDDDDCDDDSDDHDGEIDRVTGTNDADKLSFNITDDDPFRADLRGGLDTVKIRADDETDHVRITFTENEVGNGDPRDSDSQDNQDGGLAVRVRAEDEDGRLTGPTSRFDDEGIRFVAQGGLTFDVRELTDGSRIGDDFEVVVLGSSGDDFIDESDEHDDDDGYDDDDHDDDDHDDDDSDDDDDHDEDCSCDDDDDGDKDDEDDGNVYANGGRGDDVIIGGDGDDYLIGGAGRDKLFGNDGRDTLIGGAGMDLLVGGDGHDTLNGGRGDDWLEGGDGNDRLDGGRGDDRIDGGRGSDTVNFDISEDGSDRVNLGSGLDRVNVSGNDGVEEVRLTLTGGEIGDGSARESGDRDNQDGGLGVRLQAEDEDGNTTGPVSRFDDEGIVFDGRDDGIRFDVRETATGNERGSYDVVILGTDGDDRFDERGTTEDQYINGGRGSDELYGGGGQDFLAGGAGRDLLNGGRGDDTLQGGNGDDVFQFRRRPGDDTILDFESGSDQIDLSAFDIDEDDIETETLGGDTIVFVDTNGDGEANFNITLKNVDQVAASDFMFG
jgi:hypothetical protein